MAELSAYEQLMLELVNRARLDPLGEAARFGISLNQGLPSGTLSGTAKQVLAPNELLVDSARAHSQWMLDVDKFSHTGVGGSDPGDRMIDAGYVFSGSWTWGENIAWMGTTGTPDVAAYTASLHRNLFLSAGHRENILAGSFRELGTGILEGRFTASGTTYNAVMATQNFAASGSNYFVTGVAYTDLDGDSFYDIGEALGGLTVTVTSGATTLGTDITASAGGYAIGLASTSAVVTFSGGGLATSVSVTVSGGDANAKVDLVDGTEIFTSVSATLGAGATELRLLGIANLNGTGNDADNVLYGNGGANVLNGGAGADTMIGGKGNDTFWFDDLGDVAIEAASGGTDKIYTPFTTTLATNMEGLYLQGTDAVSGTGNAAANTIVGNAAANVIAGLGGSDRLTGSGGNDTFVFNTKPSTTANRDIVTDFTNVAGNNDIFHLENAVFTKLAKLGTLSSANFKAATKAIDSNDFIIYNKSTGALYYDSNANASGGMVQIATLSNKVALSAADFFII